MYLYVQRDPNFTSKFQKKCRFKLNKRAPLLLGVLLPNTKHASSSLVYAFICEVAFKTNSWFCVCGCITLCLTWRKEQSGQCFEDFLTRYLDFER